MMNEYDVCSDIPRVLYEYAIAFLQINVYFISNSNNAAHHSMVYFVIQCRSISMKPPKSAVAGPFYLLKQYALVAYLET